MPEPQTSRLVCAACGYDRSGTPERACPECGSTAEPDLETVETGAPARTLARVTIPLATFFVMGGLLFTQIFRNGDAQAGLGLCVIAGLFLLAISVMAVESWAQRPIPGDPEERRARGRAAGFYAWGITGLIAILAFLSLLDT